MPTLFEPVRTTERRCFGRLEGASDFGEASAAIRIALRIGRRRWEMPYSRFPLPTVEPLARHRSGAGLCVARAEPTSLIVMCATGVFVRPGSVAPNAQVVRPDAIEQLHRLPSTLSTTIPLGSGISTVMFSTEVPFGWRLVTRSSMSPLPPTSGISLMCEETRRVRSVGITLTGTGTVSLPFSPSIVVVIKPSAARLVVLRGTTVIVTMPICCPGATLVAVVMVQTSGLIAQVPPLLASALISDRPLPMS